MSIIPSAKRRLPDPTRPDPAPAIGGMAIGERIDESVQCHFRRDLRRQMTG